MTDQLQLGFREPAPVVDSTDLALITHLLATQEDWIKARELTRMTAFDDRKLRAIASASKGAIISGCKGYRLTRTATIQEIAHCTAKLRSQANAMTDRALQIDRVYHGRKFA